MRKLFCSVLSVFLSTAVIACGNIRKNDVLENAETEVMQAWRI